MDSFSTTLTFSVNYYYYFSFNNFPSTLLLLLLLHERLNNPPNSTRLKSFSTFHFAPNGLPAIRRFRQLTWALAGLRPHLRRRGKSWPARNSSFEILVASSIDDGFLHHFLCYSTNLSSVFFHSQQPLFIYFVLYFGPQLWSSRPWEKAAITPEKNGNLLIPSQSQQAKHIPASLNYFTIF